MITILKKHETNKLIFSIISLSLIIISICLDSNEALKNMWWMFLIQLISATFIIKDFKDKVYYIFSPSFLLICYVNISFIIGGLAYNYNLIYEREILNHSHFEKLIGMNISIAYMLACSWVIIFTIKNWNLKSNLVLNNLSSNNLSSNNLSSNNLSSNNLHLPKILFFIVLIIFFSFINIDFSIIGGVGDFSIIPKTILSNILFYYLAKNKVKYRILIYFLIIIVFTLTNFESKRDALFLLIPILFFESYFKNIVLYKINLRIFLFTILGIPILILLILVMTISRGFGQYPIDNSIDAIKYVPELVEDYDILSLIVTTSEAPVTTFHSLNSMSFLNQNPDNLAYGSTYIKVLFIFLPKQIFGYKPESMTSIYTSFHDSDFASIGGSLPINIYAESYWNFHIFGIVIIFLILYFLNTCYFKIYKLLEANKFNYLTLILLFSYTHIIGFYRGYSFDLFTVLIMVSAIFSLFFSKTILKLFDL